MTKKELNITEALDCTTRDHPNSPIKEIGEVSKRNEEDESVTLIAGSKSKSMTKSKVFSGESIKRANL